jgi:hypothetical protein
VTLSLLFRAVVMLQPVQERQREVLVLLELMQLVLRSLALLPQHLHGEYVHRFQCRELEPSSHRDHWRAFEQLESHRHLLVVRQEPLEQQVLVEE